MRARWCTVLAVLMLLGACSSAAPPRTAPEPPPATALPEPAPVATTAPAAAAEPQPVAETPPVAEVVPVAPLQPVAPADDDPLLEGPIVGAAPRPAPVATAAAGAGAVQAASAPRTSGSPTPTGRIEIPAIGLNHATYEGIDLATLNHGPGHWPGTAMPGQPGNTVFPGHRTTYSRPFWDIDRLAPGHEVIFTTAAGRFTYRVTEKLIIAPTDTWVVKPTPGATFTIIACHPKGSARQRYVVKGALVSGASAAPTQPSGGGMPVLTTTTTKRRGLLGLLGGG